MAALSCRSSWEIARVTHTHIGLRTFTAIASHGLVQGSHKLSWQRELELTSPVLLSVTAYLAVASLEHSHTPSTSPQIARGMQLQLQDSGNDQLQRLSQ